MDYRKIAQDALRERAEIFEKRKALFDSDATDAEKREQSEKMDADMNRLGAEAREAVEAGERESEIRDLNTRAGGLSVPTPGVDNQGEDRASEFLEGLRAVALGDARSFDFTASADAFEKRVNMVSDGTAVNKAGNAGPITPDTFVAQLLESLEEASEIYSKVRKISTASGEPMNWPRRVSKAGGTFQKIQENGTYPDATEGSFELFTLTAHKFGAIAEITEEALTDPALNVGSIVAQDMGEDLAESLSLAILNGAAGTLTQSILPSVVNVETFASGTAVTFDELIALQHAIRQPYRKNASWTISDALALQVRQLKDGNQNYVWQPAVVAGQPDMLLGKPVATESGMPDPALNALGVLFGDLNRFYLLRQVRNISIVRSDEHGFDRDTVALKIRWRGDGGVTDPEAMAVGKFAAV